MTGEKLCQSCAMPLTEESLLGTNADGTKNGEYCIYCYKTALSLPEDNGRDDRSASPMRCRQGLSR